MCGLCVHSRLGCGAVKDLGTALCCCMCSFWYHWSLGPREPRAAPTPRRRMRGRPAACKPSWSAGASSFGSVWIQLGPLMGAKLGEVVGEAGVGVGEAGEGAAPALGLAEGVALAGRAHVTRYT